MTERKNAARNSIYASLDDLIDGATDGATEDMLFEVVSAIWRGFASPADIDALIRERADDGYLFDIDKVSAGAAETFAKKRIEEAEWPLITDCERLDLVFVQLQGQGICALHFTGDTLTDGFEAVIDALSEDGVPEDRYHGYCFYHGQDIDHAINQEGLTLAFGHVERSGAAEEEHVAVGMLVCDALRQEGLEVVWNGSAKRRIVLPKLSWQRRTPA